MNVSEKETTDLMSHRVSSEIFGMAKDDFTIYSPRNKERRYIISHLPQDENHRHIPMREKNNFLIVRMIKNNLKISGVLIIT